jgi:hypothetical protein
MAKQFEDEEEAPKKGHKQSLELEDEEFSGPKKGFEGVEVSDDDDCEFGDAKLMKKSDGLDRIRPGKGEVVRFAILPGFKPKKAMNHYIDKKGTYRCLSTPDAEGSCCRTLGSSDLHIAALAVRYVNANRESGKYSKEVVETSVEVGFVYLSRTNFADISGLVQEDEKVDDFDIVMSHNTSGIGYKMSRVSKEARWKKDKAVQEAVLKAAAKFEDGMLLTKKLGKKINAVEWKQLLASISTGDEGDDGSNTDL